jgi:hypothetical protein
MASEHESNAKLAAAQAVKVVVRLESEMGAEGKRWAKGWY